MVVANGNARRARRKGFLEGGNHRFGNKAVRESLIPPAVLPLEPPIAMHMAMIRNAPEEKTVVSWLFVTFWKPVVVAAATTMNTPRRSSAHQIREAARSAR